MSLSYERKHQVAALFGLATFRSNTETVRSWLSKQVSCTCRDNAPVVPAEAFWYVTVCLVSNRHQLTPFCKLCCSLMYCAVSEPGYLGALQIGTTLDSSKQFVCCERWSKYSSEKNVQTCFVLLCTSLQGGSLWLSHPNVPGETAWKIHPRVTEP